MKKLIINNSNCKAVSLAEDFINNPSRRILWIYGKSGCGKTELANYLIQKFKDNNKKAYPSTTEQFINLVVRMIRNNEPLISLISYCQDYDLLVFDHTDLTLEEKLKTQIEFKYLISEIIKNGRTKVVLISNKRPRKLKNLMFRTPYCYCAHLKNPTTDFKINLLNNWAFQNKISISRSRILNMAMISRNLFHLKGLFNQFCLKYSIR
jgi:chromosomal replication initiation ATPase DnaA